jgi:hypothetical protein
MPYIIHRAGPLKGGVPMPPFAYPVIAVVLLAAVWVVIEAREEHTREVEDARHRGCHCKMGFLGWIVEPECPVHWELCAVKDIENWVGRKILLPIWTYGKRIWICHDCITRLRPDLRMMPHKQQIENCVCCARLVECLYTPEHLFKSQPVGGRDEDEDEQVEAVAGRAE